MSQLHTPGAKLPQNLQSWIIKLIMAAAPHKTHENHKNHKKTREPRKILRAKSVEKLKKGP
jgi:hypothetical protein